jgi:hypothetical protein
VNVVPFLAFGFAALLFAFLTIAKEIVYGQAVREQTDRDRWVSDLRARQLDQICNEQEARP